MLRSFHSVIRPFLAKTFKRLVLKSLIVLPFASFGSGASGSEPPISRDSTWVVSGITVPAKRTLVLTLKKIRNADGSEGRHGAFTWPIPLEADEYHERIRLRDGNGSYHLEVELCRDFDESLSGRCGRSTAYEIEVQDDRPVELIPTDYVESDDPRIVSLANEITADQPTPLAKSLAIHDWVAANIFYDSERAGRIDIGNASASERSATETLMTRTGVCSGYSNLTAALHRAAGIPARVIWGYSGSTDGASRRVNHAWNEVKIGDAWIPMDTTFDKGNPPRRAYFNPTEAVFTRDHLKIEIKDR